MFSYRVDHAHANCVWLFSGPTNTDEDWERYVATFAALDAIAWLAELPACILLVDRENPTPNALWRKRIAEASTSLRSRPLVAFASEALLFRGAITAVNWLRPPPYEFRTMATFDQAVQWIEQRRGVPAKTFFTMLAELREEAAAASAGKRVVAGLGRR
jgi:hypothetical protein